jgi:single-strand DNA-binding protein
MNNVSIIGRLTKDYEVKHTPAGKAIGALSIAVNDGWGDNKHTSFYEVTVFGKSVERHKLFIGKGSLVGITGSLRQERWESNGEKRSKVKIVANQIDYLDPKKEESEW